MSALEFCTCTYLECADHPSRHAGSCTPCIAKNLKHHEIPVCFWKEIGNTENAKSNYIFMRFAEKVMAVEK